ncbi:MAG: class I SAM-dependent rRNA methyltransferase [Smithellaceae bacterium]|nr:class I SAM-dependent rRNA methyltransferase [Smithellaceae bacterium]
MKGTYRKLRLKPGRELSLVKGHPWIFSGAVSSVEGNPAPGEVVLAADSEGKALALGFFNPKTDIVFRLLTYDTAAEIDASFWRERLAAALSLREKLIPPRTSAYRLINAEGDGIPGLVVDHYGEVLVCSFTTAGAELNREGIATALLESARPRTIYERSEGKSRQMEGYEDREGAIHGEAPEKELEITENGLKFRVDVIAGQKTGFFLDQRDNRDLLERLSKGRTVLNCFSYTGGFSVYCARGGAARVVSVEASEQANAMAVRNLEANGFTGDAFPVVRDDVFQYLRRSKEQYDLIILDPPAFSKSKKDLPRSSKGYKDINLQAMGRLKEGGLLATFSCSNHVDEELFRKIVLGAAMDAGKTARLLRVLGPGPDHPTALSHPEGRYLKGFLLAL